jgi:tetratricopeptide (TPR) repeat protein
MHGLKLHLFSSSSFCGLIAVVGLAVTPFYAGFASDHLDTPTVIADPAADIGDIYAWTSADGRRLNLIMDIVAHQFSDRLQYVFHVDSGRQFGKTTASTLVVCRFDATSAVECWVGDTDYVRGDASNTTGLEGENKRFRVFAGLRDDPFFNNVKGTREMYGVAGSALQHGTTVDGAGCPQFDAATSHSILDTWRHTSGGPAKNFLAGWAASSLVLSIDLDVVNKGGDLLAVWGAVHKIPRGESRRVESMPGKTGPIPALGEPIERTARPLIKTALVGGPLAPDNESDQRKEAYNRVARDSWAQFSAPIQKTLGLYDGFDGRCGNQWLADNKAKVSARYERLAKILADDRVWVNSKSKVCNQFLAVELTEFKSPGASSGDCGGRTPNYDASNIFRSLLTNGTMSGADDGLHQDDKVHSATDFPFWAAPAVASTSRMPKTDNGIAINSSLETTSSVIALANLDQQIGELRDEEGVEELLLLWSRFLADYDTLGRASSLGEERFTTSRELLERARTRSAVHRFADALDDLAAAQRAGARPNEVAALRASILVATGGAAQAIPQLEASLYAHPGFASRGTLAGAYAAVGRFEDADHLYAEALTDLDTTLPFPHAWTWFARGLMWGDQAGDQVRAEGMYRRALDYLPEFVQANIHLAEIEALRADVPSAITRLERVVQSSHEPEALALLGVLRSWTGGKVRGAEEIAAARQRYEVLIARHPLAFADHGAEFYLGAGSDPERAWVLAQQNLANRQTDRAVVLAIKAAQASGHYQEACDLLKKYPNSEKSVRLQILSPEGIVVQ